MPRISQAIEVGTGMHDLEMHLYPIAFVLPHSLPPLVRLTHNQLTTTINILVTRFLRLVIRCLLIFIQP